MVTTTTTQRSAWRLGTRAAKWLLGGALVVWSSVAPAMAAPTVQQMLQFKPKQDGIILSTPEPDKFDSCKVELVKGAQKGSGWVLKDAQGNLLRNFFDSTDRGRPDVWSYYKDGKEVYREIDTTVPGKPDQYRWLNDAGTKWGIDEAKDGKIKSWKVISPEEVSQEIVAALVGKDFRRLQVLMITDAEMKALELSPNEIARIKKAQLDAPAKFNETAGSMTKLNAKSVYQNLLTNGSPVCIPGEHVDVIKHLHATIVIDVNDKDRSTEMVQSGELIQVGNAWRIVGAPVHGSNDTASMGDPGNSGIDTNNPKLQAIVQELTKLDKDAMSGPVGPAHHLKRADILEQIIAEVKDTEREPWIRQVADSLSSAAQSSPATDKTAQTRLNRLVDQIVKAMPGTNLAAYVTFRQLQADYTLKISGKDDFNAIQTEWIKTLSQFYTTYPKSEDAPEALLQLGIVNEFLNKEVEAKNWYGQLARNFADNKQALKAKGAIRRLEMDGQPVKITGATLKDPNIAFDSDQLRGKMIIVYYWASWNSQAVGDFAKLKLVLDGNKDVELLAINLDTTIDEARAYLSKSPAPGVHLQQPGGLEGKLALEYGVVTPPNMFLIGKDGKCITHVANAATVEEEIKKAAEKK